MTSEARALYKEAFAHGSLPMTSQGQPAPHRALERQRRDIRARPCLMNLERYNAGIRYAARASSVSSAARPSFNGGFGCS